MGIGNFENSKSKPVYLTEESPEFYLHRKVKSLEAIEVLGYASSEQTLVTIRASNIG
jgi:hypothetical protein